MIVVTVVGCLEYSTSIEGGQRSVFHQILTLWNGLGMPATEPVGPCIRLSNTNNPYMWLPQVLAGLAVPFFGLGLAATLLSTRAASSRTIRRLIFWPFLLATGVAVLGVAWSWELYSSYNDGGCVVYVQSAPFDSESISLVIAVLLLGLLVALAVYLVLDIYLVIRLRTSRRTAS
jgi:RsiW-degrading membrane proteinase PrsW (M82 family)